MTAGPALAGMLLTTRSTLPGGTSSYPRLGRASTSRPFSPALAAVYATARPSRSTARTERLGSQRLEEERQRAVAATHIEHRCGVHVGQRPQEERGPRIEPGAAEQVLGHVEAQTHATGGRCRASP